MLLLLFIFKIFYCRFVHEERNRIHEHLFEDHNYNADIAPIMNHTHTHPVEVDIWIELHTINEG